jgi:hypothetical protein
MKKRLHIAISIALTAVCLVYTFTAFSGAFNTLVTSASELWQSFLAYITFMFTYKIPDKIDTSPSQTPEPVTPPSGNLDNILPVTLEELQNKFSRFLGTLFDGGNFGNYIKSLDSLLVTVFSLLPFAILFFYMLKRYLRRQFTNQNNNYNKDSKPLKIFKAYSSKVYTPAKNNVIEYLAFARDNRFIKLWLLIWLFNFNVFALLLSTVGILLYFFVALDFTALYFYIYNAIERLLPAMQFIPWWLWLALALWVIDCVRKSIAIRRQRHMESKDKGFIKERSICTMLVGTMGKGKTTTLVDMALSAETIHRTQAYEKLIEIDLKFPAFPWIVFERQVIQQIQEGSVYNFATCGVWIERKQAQYERIIRRAIRRGVSPETVENKLSGTDYIFGYDSDKYGLYYDNKLKMVYLFDCLKDYVKFYFIYIMAPSLIVANFSIRTDFQKQDAGNFPTWDLDFFARDSRTLSEQSRHAHVLDFDMLRLGKKVIENNPNGNVFEFGVICITEIGKERGNQFKSQEIKETIKNLKEVISQLTKVKEDAKTERGELLALTTKANQLTDKFNDTLKLVRHKGTVDGICFVRVFMDEQRPESLGADARDLCEIVQLKDKSETRLAMPFYFIEELLHDWLYPKFQSIYEDYRYNRGDNTLLMYLIKKIAGISHNHHLRIYNRFGYHIRQIAVEDAGTGQELKTTNYYLNTKKIYADRFNTAAYEHVFSKNLQTAGIGLADMPEYGTTTATIDELKMQNSYFMNDVMKHGDPNAPPSGGSP